MISLETKLQHQIKYSIYVSLTLYYQHYVVLE